ncbi:EAL domain-containing protein [Neiella marina]|uniref:EAL domain-containing protein n=1 Tax=Neiella holothuriorum TaxID=2870530 RepID=A0ABS7EC61_9GAMM|nr:EAL domain-containing protein [Neiella holothuriorum]MBW8189431.1 EAL domain-containing protein [Neiella holothuriorum]
MRLTQRLTTMWLVSTLIAVSLTAVGILWSVQTLAQQRQQQRIEQIAQQVASVLAESEQPTVSWQGPPLWLTTAMDIAAVKALQVRYGGHLLVQLGAHQPQHRQVQVTLHNDNRALQLTASFNNPWLEASWSWYSVAILLLMLSLVGLTAWRGSLWFVRRLQEVDNIGLRAQQILKGEMVLSGEAEERPRVIRQALDKMVTELLDARQERSRFDAFMRTNTFLDPVTGLGNRLYFDNQINSAIRAGTEHNSGFVLLLQFNQYDDIQQHEDRESYYEILNHIGRCLYDVYDAYSDSFLARRGEGDYAVLLPGTHPDDIERSIKSVFRSLGKIPMPSYVDIEHCFHIGVASLETSTESYQVLAEADMALRAAQVQEANTWFMYQRNELPRNEIKGSVRWRTLLEESVRRKAFVLSSQPVVTALDEDIHHYEMLLRLRDESGQMMPAQVFLPMARKCGMTSQIDRNALHQLLKLMRYEGRQPTRCSINIAIDSLLDRNFGRWIELILMQYNDIIDRVIVEVSEYSLNQNYEAARPIIRKLKQAGCLLAVDQVGQKIVSTNYIRDLEVDYLKLHANLVRDIEQRSENQLFVRSLLGACENTTARVFALAVETQREWQTLKSLGVYGGQGHLFSEAWRDSPAFLG